MTTTIDNETDQYLSWLKKNGYTMVVATGDGRWVGLRRLLFHWTMHIGKIGDVTGYDDRYCLANFDLALESFNDWIVRDFEGDPINWHRHPKSGRRRTDADSEQEYIAD